ncbi:MAG: sigma-54 dependent transcriptional regulator [Pseudomonadota bacterium]
MLNLVDRILVVAEPADTETVKLIKKLNDLELDCQIVGWNENVWEFPEPTIVCGERSDLDILRQNHQAPTELGIVVWNHADPDSGTFISYEDEHYTEQQVIELSFKESIYTLIQSHLQCNPSYADSSHYYWPGNMIGSSPEFTRMLKLAGKIAKIDCDVLIQGETGTGKELVARSIHYQSDRMDYPFVPINCGAFSDELLLSELFGHTKGAFTGANTSRVGLIEQAENGTLFLDEIDSLSGKAQVALLRYLQDREIRPQGSNDLRKCDTRVLAASNKPLQELVESNQFREDLLFRLDVLHIDLPPLRNRGNDIHLLVQYFICQAAQEFNHKRHVFSPNMVQTMTGYGWPGNIRQLQNIVYRLCLLSDQFVIRTDYAEKLAGVNWRDYLPTSKKPTMSDGMQKEKQRVIEGFETNYLKNVLSQTSGNISKAARIAQKERRSFIRLMKKYGIQRDEFLPNQG